jgi:hypothetical protein
VTHHGTKRQTSDVGPTTSAHTNVKHPPGRRVSWLVGCGLGGLGSTCPLFAVLVQLGDSHGRNVRQLGALVEAQAPRAAVLAFAQVRRDPLHVALLGHLLPHAALQHEKLRRCTTRQFLPGARHSTTRGCVAKLLRRLQASPVGLAPSTVALRRAVAQRAAQREALVPAVEGMDDRPTRPRERTTSSSDHSV